MNRPYAVTVIVPVHNVLPYVEACLESVANQTLRSLEVIVVDDCSTDGSAEVIDRYVARYDFFRVVRLKQNVGLYAARKAGLSLARGEYIGFVDGDDRADPRMFEKLYERAVSSQADMVFCNFFKCFLDGSRKGISYDTKTLEQIARFNQGELRMILSYYPHWNRITRRPIFDQLEAENYTLEGNVFMAEDFADVLPMIYLSQRLEYLPESLYFYTVREKIHYRMKDIADVQKVMQAVLSFFDRHRHSDRRLHRKTVRTIENGVFRSLGWHQLTMIHMAATTDAPKKELLASFKQMIVDEPKPLWLAFRIRIVYYIFRYSVLYRTLRVLYRTIHFAFTGRRTLGTLREKNALR